MWHVGCCFTQFAVCKCLLCCQIGSSYRCWALGPLVLDASVHRLKEHGLQQQQQQESIAIATITLWTLMMMIPQHQQNELWL